MLIIKLYIKLYFFSLLDIMIYLFIYELIKIKSTNLILLKIIYNITYI